MMRIAQIVEPAEQWPSIPWDVPAPTPAPEWLGKHAPQVPTTTKPGEYELVLVTAFRKWLVTAGPQSKLEVLKKHTFAPEGRANRIAASLAALNAPQPTVLTKAEWREIIEEVEDDED
jgi:hypothetical protein